MNIKEILKDQVELLQVKDFMIKHKVTHSSVIRAIQRNAIDFVRFGNEHIIVNTQRTKRFNFRRYEGSKNRN